MLNDKVDRKNHRSIAYDREAMSMSLPTGGFQSPLPLLVWPCDFPIPMLSISFSTDHQVLPSATETNNSLFNDQDAEMGRLTVVVPKVQADAVLVHTLRLGLR